MTFSDRGLIGFVLQYRHGSVADVGSLLVADHLSRENLILPSIRKPGAIHIQARPVHKYHHIKIYQRHMMGLSIALVERLPGWPLGLHPFAADFVIKAIGSLALAASFEGMVLDGFVPLLPPSFGRNLLQFCIAQDKFFLAKMMMSHSQCQGSSAGSPLFPRAFEPRVLHIFICSHLHLFTSSSHLHHILSSSHLHSLSLSLSLSSHLHIFSSSSHLHIFTSCRRGATKWQSFRTK